MTEAQMTKKTNLDDYYDFFQELPQADLKHDYLDDIEIQDEYESPADSTGLSSEQVRQIARDSLEKAKNERFDNPEPSQA
ncbi:MAG: hypothetical protein NVSMB39_3990 [Candidatus Saccharimonadales bacterium]